jgi:hypothetical protein
MAREAASLSRACPVLNTRERKRGRGKRKRMRKRHRGTSHIHPRDARS